MARPPKATIGKRQVQLSCSPALRPTHPHRASKAYSTVKSRYRANVPKCCNLQGAGLALLCSPTRAQLTFAPSNRTSSTMVPRGDTGPPLLSVAACEGQDKLSQLQQVVRSVGGRSSLKPCYLKAEEWWGQLSLPLALGPGSPMNAQPELELPCFPGKVQGSLLSAWLGTGPAYPLS